MNIVPAIDDALTTIIYTLPHSPWIDGFFHFFSASGIFALVWTVLFAIVIAIQENRHKRFIYSFFGSIIITSFLTNVILKNLFHRDRPLTQLASTFVNNMASGSLFHPAQYPTDFSFPSGHATFAFAAAYILAQYDQKHRSLFYAVAILVAFSRVYLGYHYVGDVVIGSVIGLGVSWLTLYIVDRKFTTD